MNNECRDCKWFEPKQKTKDGVLGECRDALERARAVVPFAINLDVTMVFGHGGKICPMFDRT